MRTSRRAHTVIVLFVMLFVSIPAGRTDEAQPALRYEASTSVMGSVFTIATYGAHRGHLASSVEAAFEEARRLDNLLSHYKPQSELSQINREAFRKPVVVSEEMAKLLERCLEYSRVTEGAFDITVGPLMKTWGFSKGAGRLPSSRAVARARAKVGYEHVEVNVGNRTVRFRKSGMKLDPGGFGKGYAVDRMAAVLREAGVTVAFVTAGESSIYALGAPPQESPGWNVRIRDPKGHKITAAEVYLKDRSLSTSGTYEKFFEAGGKIYSHIMDPRSGMPAQGVAAVSVLAPSTLDSEVWTKAFFVNGLVWSTTNKPSAFDVFVCQQDSPCQWIQDPE